MEPLCARRFPFKTKVDDLSLGEKIWHKIPFELFSYFQTHI